MVRVRSIVGGKENAWMTSVVDDQLVKSNDYIEGGKSARYGHSAKTTQLAEDQPMKSA